MSVESKLNAILANQATIIANQATILTHVDASGGGDGTDIVTELKTLEGQVSAITAIIGDDTTGAVGQALSGAQSATVDAATSGAAALKAE